MHGVVHGHGLTSKQQRSVELVLQERLCVEPLGSTRDRLVESAATLVSATAPAPSARTSRPAMPAITRRRRRFARSVAARL